MNPVQQCLLVLWSALLSAVICLGFLPISHPFAVLLMIGIWCLIVAVWYLFNRQPPPRTDVQFDNLPEANYHQPVVLVCGDLPHAWPVKSRVLTVSQGCWIRVDYYQNMEKVARQLLRLRPDWGRQLSVMISVCPQKHSDTTTFTSHLLSLRGQISQFRRTTGYSLPLVLSGQVGSAMMKEPLWQVAVAGQDVSVWRGPTTPGTIPAWRSTGEAVAMQQQVPMNSLMSWLSRHVIAIFVEENPDLPAIAPTLVLWGIGPLMEGSQLNSAWTTWLTQHTALHKVADWHPVRSMTSAMWLSPDFVLPLLPKDQWLTRRWGAWRVALVLFTLAAIIALLSSGWNNRQLLHRLNVDIQHYNQISMDDYGPKAEALKVLHQHAAQLANWASKGEPLRLSLGLYHGERLRIPLLAAIQAFVASPPPVATTPKPVLDIIRFDSMSLFESNEYSLKTGANDLLFNALHDIKARPGWLIVVAGHSDNTGNALFNQKLSVQRAETVRNWMRDTGGVPENCIAVEGYGDSRPLATNDTPEGRAVNRRVEIRLIPETDACQPPDATPEPSPEENVLPQPE